jgi:hypothetical protein
VEQTSGEETAGRAAVVRRRYDAMEKVRVARVLVAAAGLAGRPPML